MMPTLSLAIHILAIHLIFLAHQIQGGQFLLRNEETEYAHVFGPGDDKYKVYFAAHTTSGGSFYGLVLTMDVYGYNLTNGQVSTTKIIISNLEGDPKSDKNAIWVGWHVYPDHYGDTSTRFFTLWTRDTYRSTGCFNMVCPGFEPTSGSGIAPGAIIDPVSDVKGAPQKLTIKMFLDRDTGDWWVHAGFNGSTAVVGRFPAKLFDTLSRKATHIGLGGVVEALFTSLVFLSTRVVEICGDLVFTQYSPIPANTLPQKYSTM
uniref:Uncharacterized protein n=1 Tax=Avena sativa TaxID=4498 RepID=A0ACD5Y3Y9_AVESA